MYKVICEPADDNSKDLTCADFTTQSLSPQKHEIVLLDDKKKETRLIEVSDKPRQATGPLRYLKVTIVDEDDNLVWGGDVAGNSYVAEIADTVEEAAFKSAFDALPADATADDRKKLIASLSQGDLGEELRVRGLPIPNSKNDRIKALTVAVTQKAA